MNNPPGPVTDEVLAFTDGHPHYTQQLAYATWNILKMRQEDEKPVKRAIFETIQIHDLDFERLWNTFNNTDKRTLTTLAQQAETLTSPLSKAANLGPASTVFSSLKRLMKSGTVIKTERAYEIDDPFFKQLGGDRKEFQRIPGRVTQSRVAGPRPDRNVHAAFEGWMNAPSAVGKTHVSRNAI